MTVEPSTAVITSPFCRPALSAGAPEATSPTLAPAGSDESDSLTPRYGCVALPSAISCATTVLTVFDGTAKPIPMLPPDDDSIWLLTPITRPFRSSSGPPLLPLLIAASVWMAPPIGWLLGDVIVRSSALTMPAVTVFSRP